MARRSGKSPPGKQSHHERRDRVSSKAAGNPRPVHPYRDPARLEARARAQSDDALIRIAGLPSVAELFEKSADRVERLYFDSALKKQVEPYCTLLARRRKVYRQLGAEEMERVAGTSMHGGIVALARQRPIREFDAAALEACAADGAPLLVLDGVGNPQNIGAIARTAAFYGIRRLLISDHPGQSGLSDASYRIAKGGLEWIDIYRANNLPETLRRIARHFHVVGTAVERGVRLDRVERSGKPLALVLGNEEDGLPPATLAACQTVIALLGSGRVQSLNVSATAAILIHTLLARS